MPGQPDICGECKFFWQDGFHDAFAIDMRQRRPIEEHKGFCLAHAPGGAIDPQPECCLARFPVVYTTHPACGDGKK